MAHYKFADVLEGKGDENVLDNSHACGDLHRTRNQRLLAGRVLIPRKCRLSKPVGLQSRRAWFVSLPAVPAFLRIIAHAMCAPTASMATYSQENVALPNRNCDLPAAAPLSRRRQRLSRWRCWRLGWTRRLRFLRHGGAP